ncbi:hypothetical protein K503DRAFT_776105 [Rhizopogon vinicolor AM-OR11-026]|uniref:Uncharacterized protein n=1 Tax=Rhizopogon vinicolor AM-OR11-026 TaxID=1314800 RepID=A0A1B7MK73_9AGAM|nr:hypothetical protein K503DRAFT_776105 [Rhizopogon vinicolor AM-OR11-026]
MLHCFRDTALFKALGRLSNECRDMLLRSRAASSLFGGKRAHTPSYQYFDKHSEFIDAKEIPHTHGRVTFKTVINAAI